MNARVVRATTGPLRDAVRNGRARATHRAAVLAAAAALATSGCGGAGHAALPPSAGAKTGAVRHAAVRFVMRWPAHGVRSKRRAAFVSPSTMSVVVLVNASDATPGPVTFANAPSAAGGTSTIAIEAPVGADVFDIALYDAPQSAGETTAQGNLLGSVEVSQTIAPDVLNTVNATVIGTVASVKLGPMANQRNVVAASFAGVAGYELIGRDPATFVATALDADGNVIVQPDAPPAIAIAANPRSQAILAVTPVSGAANEVTVQAVAPNATTYPTALDASAADANGNAATSSTIVDVTSALYVAYANAGAPVMERYAPDGTPFALPSGAFAGMRNPVALAYDADDRQIFVADAGLGTVLAFDENGTPVSGFTAAAIAGVDGVTYDPNLKNVYASGPSGIVVFAPNGGKPNGGVPASFAAANAAGVAFGLDGPYGSLDQLAIAERGPSPVVAFTDEAGNAAGSAGLTSAPLAIAFGAPLTASTQPIQSAAQVYVTEASAIGALSAYGQSVATINDSGGPSGVVVDPNLAEPIVADRTANRIAAYLGDLSAADPAHTFTTPSALSVTQPQGVCSVF